MLAKNEAFVVDLATDDTASTTSQLVTSVKNKISAAQLDCDSVVNESPSDPANQVSTNVMILSKSEVAESIILNSKVFVSDDCLKSLFQAKSYLDILSCRHRENFLQHVYLVTSTSMMKFWEMSCSYLMTPFMSWSLIGVIVEGQQHAASILVDLNIEHRVREAVRAVGNPSEVRILRSSVFPEDRFNAGYHERTGGASQLSALASMNMIYTPSKVDPLVVIEENRRRLAEAAQFDHNKMHVTKVEHGCTIWVVGREEQPARFDGLTTNLPGITICAGGADCCMILLADMRTGAVGAVHSGWRGTTLGVVRTLIHRMAREFGTAPLDIRASIGPAICGHHYDRTAEEVQPITALDPTLTWPNPARKGWMHVDLVKANVIMLQREGVLVGNIDISQAHCTWEHDRFFSYRRDGFPFGNQLGFISCRSKAEVK